jgi:hypothetical protein
MRPENSDLAPGRDPDQILEELREWRRQHPKASLYEIERETMKRMAQLQAQILEELSQGPSPEESDLDPEIPVCGECGAKMQRRGQAERQLQGPGGQAIHLKRSFWVCPACGAGIFPPG